MNIRIAWWVVVFLMSWSSLHAQPWSFTRLPLHTVEQGPSDLVAGATVGYSNVPPVVWKGAVQIATSPTSSGSVAASSIDPNQTMTLVLSTGALIRVTSDGTVTEVEDFVFTARALSLLSYDVDRTLVVRPDGLLKHMLVFDLDNITTLSIDTIRVDSVKESVLYHNPIAGSVSLTLLHTVDGMADTTSFDWDRTSRTWTERAEALYGTMIVYPDGEVKWFSTQKTPPLNHAVLVNGNVLLAIHYDLTTGRVYNIRRSNDRGLTYEAVPELDTLVTSIRDIVAWPGGSAMIATARNGLVQWFPDGRVVRPSAPRVNALYPFAGLIAHSAGSGILLGTGNSGPSAPVWNVDKKTWEPLPDSATVRAAYGVDDRVIVVRPNSTASIWDPASATSIPVLNAGNPFSIGESVAAVQYDDMSVLLIGQWSTWYQVGSDGSAEAITVDMPRRYLNQSASSVVDIGGGAVRVQNGDILVGSRSGYYYTSEGVLTPQCEVMGVLRTSDLGKTWSASSTGLGSNTYIRQLHRGGDGLLYCIAAYDQGLPTRGEVYISRDEGASWEQVPASLPGTIVRDAKIFVSKRGHITISSRGLVRSTDGGSTWSDINGNWPADAQVHYALEQPWDDRLAVATTHGIYVSDVAVSVDEQRSVEHDPCDDVKGQAQLIISDLRGRVVHAASSLTDPAMEVPATLPNGVYLMSINGCTSTIVVAR